MSEAPGIVDRKSTRLNSSHPSISYAVFCLKKKKHRGAYVGAPVAAALAVLREPSRPLGPGDGFFFFNDTATTEIYTLSLHDALPIFDDHRDDVDALVDVDPELERALAERPVAEDRRGNDAPAGRLGDEERRHLAA